MKLCAALDTSSSKTAICVVNSRDGSVVFEVSVATDPAIIFLARWHRFFRGWRGLVTRLGVCLRGCIES
jgi:hypothetical protein